MLSQTRAETIVVCYRPICERELCRGERTNTHEMGRLGEIGKFVRALIRNSTAVWGIIAVRRTQFSRHIRDLIFLSNKWNKAAIITSSDVYHSQLKLTVYNLHTESIKAVIKTLTTLMRQSMHDWYVMIMKSMNVHKDLMLIIKHTGYFCPGIETVTLNITNRCSCHKRQQQIRIRVRYWAPEVWDFTYYHMQILNYRIFKYIFIKKWPFQQRVKQVSLRSSTL